ncbi:MAG: aminoacetone oxidase family FAD-binding enzyme [Gammaproteobacteria bacterium]|nr:MAG: aminoacetone oxidase family FAD-binding enzyme [Gammaproteobacteria bacterium]RLA13636.1 MAG: aminoacetone oxidase family FAD-binding enzyme [Gammaproteobacteria bacterium]
MQEKVGHYDVIIIGGGAAGLMCALTAGGRGRKVLVLEGSNKLGKKILMSGGGRCNFTNLFVEPENFLCSNPHFVKSALSRFTQWDFIALVEKHGIAYHERKHGELFCDDSSKQILAMLVSECQQVGVNLLTHCEVESVVAEAGDKPESRFKLVTSRGEYRADSVVVATGGLSIPTLGGSGFGYELARQFGFEVLPTRAGLVPFTFSGQINEMTNRLSGIAVEVSATTGQQSFNENMLFTHRGLSGPAMLQLSSYWSEGQPIFIDLLTGTDLSAWLLEMKRDQPRSLLRTLLFRRLPKSLVLELQARFWPDWADRPFADYPDAEIDSIAGNLGCWQLKPAGTEGYRTAEVTLGGVNTDALSSKTMESKTQPGLFFVGEVVDVTGHLGGFNFQWAWASGAAAGEYV